MARVSVHELKANLGVTDKQLDLVCSDDHLKKLADEIEDYHQYGYALSLKGWQLTEINTDPSLTFVMKTQAVLKRWKENDLYKATYLNLLKVVLDLSEGVLAVKLCELCKGVLMSISLRYVLLMNNAPKNLIATPRGCCIWREKNQNYFMKALY